MMLAGHTPDAIASAVAALRRGELVAMPTETVYGLAADALNDAAVARIFEAKGRPADHPLIVHVANASGVDVFAREVPEFAHRLMTQFWPGPLTLILPRRMGVAAACAGQQDSIGVRCPAHPVAQTLLHAAADVGLAGLAAPSANRFGRVSPTTAQHVAEELGDDLLILDGGACVVGIESTIVDCTRGAPVLLRPGMLTPAQLESACRLPVLDARAPAPEGTVQPRASGMLESHYAPSAQVRVMSLEQLQAALDVLQGVARGGRPSIAVYHRGALKMRGASVASRRMPDNAAAAAQELFATLRDLDSTGVKLIWVEEPPSQPEWDGVRDRLRRSSAPR